MMIPNYLYLDLSLLSKYRTQLMGIAAIMIILCHAPQYGVALPNVINSLLARGGLGVDIFLFLSGIGCYYSLSKGVRFCEWYHKRFIRIFIPYLLIQFPFWFWRLYNGTFSLLNELLVFSTIDFWLHHIGAWYVAMLVPLYLITPFIYKFLQLGHRLLKALLITILLMVLCMVNIDKFSGTTYEILYNLQWAFGRVPSFVIGMAVASYVKRSTNINSLVLIFLPLVLYIAIHKFISQDAPTQWCLVLPILTIFILISMINTRINICCFISWMGLMSLESYLANIYMCGAIKTILSPFRNTSPLLIGGYIEYSIVIFGGTLLAWLINKLSKKATAILENSKLNIFNFL